VRAHALTDRLSERDALGRLIEAVRAGESQALVVRCEAGIGKTVLLDYLARQASDSGCRVARAVGGLGEEDARVLLDSALTGPLDERIRDLIVAETRGNPLALLELPRGLTRRSWRAGSACPARRR